MPITKPSAAADSYLDNDDEDVAPKIGTTVQTGWDAADETMSKTSTGDYPIDLKFTSEPVLIKFMDAPPISYKQHWLDGIKKGRKSFTCIGEDNDCPLCNILGDEPRSKTAFNVYVLSGESTGVHILTAVPTLYRLIKKAHEDERRGPINREYWAVSRTGTGKETLYSLDYVRSRDLEEEYGIDPDDAKGLVAAAEAWSPDKIVRQENRDDLLDIARSLAE